MTVGQPRGEPPHQTSGDDLRHIGDDQMNSFNPVGGVGRWKAPFAVSAPLVDTLVIAAVAAAISMLLTGFVFGIGNNLFHLPIVAGLYNEPQYKDDAFIQSLRYFASGVWLVLADTQKYFERTDLLFCILIYLSRWLSFIGFLCCASLLGVVERRDKIIFALLACSTPFFWGFSYAGTGGMLIPFFTHSEIANGTFLLAIYFVIKGRYTAATVAWGCTFFINAFMAVWLAPLWLVTVLGHLLKRRTTIGALSLATLVGALICVPIVFPALRAIISNPELGSPLAFDYVAYLREYYPRHFLIDTSPLIGIFLMFSVTALGAVALWRFGAVARELRAVYLGAILLYLFGTVAPLISGSPLILNLHLLRSGVVIHLLAGIAALALATNWLGRDRRAMFLPGSLIVLSLAWGKLGFLLAIPVILASSYFASASEPMLTHRRRLGYLALAVAVLVVIPMRVRDNFRSNETFASGAVEWAAVGDWARQETPKTAIFMVPPPSDLKDPFSDPFSYAANFEFISHRRVWVDFKRGAAVMWAPSYYRIWHERMTEMAGLNDHAARLAYASHNGIDYVVELCGGLPSQDGVLFRTNRLCVSGVKRTVAG